MPTKRKRREKFLRPSEDDSTPARFDRSPITQLDRSRYFDNLAGISAEELASRENVKLSTITRSLEKMRAHAQRHSQSSAIMATTELYMDKLDKVSQVIDEGLNASVVVTRQVIKTRWNPELGADEQYMAEEHDILPDHATRIKTMDYLSKLQERVQPKQPLVAVDARTQIQNNAGQLGPGGTTVLSSEAIIRHIRSERGLLGDGSPQALPDILQPQAEVDVELARELAEDSDEQLAVIPNAEFIDVLPEE
jgi:hypothetical protein